MSITQTTGLGTVYTPSDIRAIADLAHAHGMTVHLDSARIWNAAAALGLPFAGFTSEVGVDVLTFGGTKNGLLGRGRGDPRPGAGVRAGLPPQVRDAVFEEAKAMAAAEGLPPNWLNGPAQPWLPPRPLEMRTKRTTPGLDVHLAPPEHLLAMKIIAFRDRDVDDIKELAALLHLEGVSPEDLRDLVARVYGSPKVLATAIGGADHDAGDELLLRCQTIGRILRTAL